VADITKSQPQQVTSLVAKHGGESLVGLHEMPSLIHQRNPKRTFLED
jgi:hypothetical protein